MQFKWDERKARANLRKHGVSFQEASTVFLDKLSKTGDDPDHSHGERRLITFGLSCSGRLLAISHLDTDDEIRIISAREITKSEREIYEEE